jgi:folate-binding protein YgfZ
MNEDLLKTYEQIRGGRAGFRQSKCGLISVWGGEAVQFLDGLITNNVKELADGEQILAAFPNAQGRLLAVVRVKRVGERFIFETEDATRDKVFQNLYRFTLAGDFFVEDTSDSYSYFEIFGPKEDVYHTEAAEHWPGAYVYELPYGASYFTPTGSTDAFRSFLADENGCVAISDDLYKILRIESGVPKYGVDMDENTIVPELGIDGLISYTKGCYIGQEIIARIHFRGHVAKQLTGLILSAPSAEIENAELTTPDCKNAGRITSSTFSPKLDKTVALAFVRYEHLAEGTPLKCGDVDATVKDLPFI